MTAKAKMIAAAHYNFFILSIGVPLLCIVFLFYIAYNTIIIY